MWPGHQTIAGSLIPPSNVVCFPHRKGPLLPPGEGELSPISGLSLFSRAAHALLGTCPCLTPFQLSKVMLLKHQGTKAIMKTEDQPQHGSDPGDHRRCSGCNTVPLMKSDCSEMEGVTTLVSTKRRCSSSRAIEHIPIAGH